MKVMEKIKRFWNETLGPDYSDDESIELKIDSTDPIEAELAHSLEEVEAKVNNKYGNSGKAQRKDMLKRQKVEKLEPLQHEEKAIPKEKEQDERTK